MPSAQLALALRSLNQLNCAPLAVTRPTRCFGWRGWPWLPWLAAVRAFVDGCDVALVTPRDLSECCVTQILDVASTKISTSKRTGHSKLGVRLFIAI